MADQPSPRRRFQFDRRFVSTWMMIWSAAVFCAAVQSIVVSAAFRVEMAHYYSKFFVAIAFLSSLVFAGGFWLKRDRSSRPSTKTRWFQFRLRTLMIMVTLMAVPMGYVGWKAKIVRERNLLCERQEVVYDSQFGMYSVLNVRRWLGDYPRGVILLDQLSPAEVVKKFQEAFPEAQIVLMPVPVSVEH